MQHYLIFDLDGTLSDPSLGITRCFHHALSSHGYETPDVELLKQCIGPQIDHAFRSIIPGVEEGEITRLITSYRERYADIGYAENSLYPGIVDALDRLKRTGFKLGVCTSKRKDYSDRILSMFDIARFFDFVSGGDVGISKQSQLKELLDTKTISPDAIMIGDRAVDINAASANALQAVGVLWGFGSYEELSEAGPVAILKAVPEIYAAFVRKTA